MSINNSKRRKTMRIIVATNNEGKLEEIREIFSNYDIVSIKEAGFDLEVDEDENTFAGNAMKKAKACAKLTGELCLADDSGLAIEYFKGWQGVKTNRWMEGTDRDRNIAIVKIMEELPKEERLDNLEEKLSRAEISFSNYDYHSEENIQEMIHSNARAIARLLVTSNK